MLSENHALPIPSPEKENGLVLDKQSWKRNSSNQMLESTFRVKVVLNQSHIPKKWFWQMRVKIIVERNVYWEKDENYELNCEQKQAMRRSTKRWFQIAGYEGPWTLCLLDVLGATPQCLWWQRPPKLSTIGFYSEASGKSMHSSSDRLWLERSLTLLTPCMAM